MRKEFERVSPESVGIRSEDILAYIDALEKSNTQMHGLMVMRHGKICAEGCWEPYAMNLRHGLQSHSKTYAATALGLLYTQGLVRLDERLIDIFPEDAPEEPGENLSLLTVKDVLCMGCGMEEEPKPSAHWIRDFLHMPVKHRPGTAYMYNSTGSSILGAIVRKRAGVGVEEYLTKHLYTKAGIHPEVHRWYCMPDGVEAGGFGMMSTIEDNLRLMKVYADGGLCNGERVLAEDFVKLATTNQNDSATEARNNPEATDNHLGYGFQIWMCQPEGVYRADGAMGQFTIVCPKQDMIIAITETAIGAHWAQSTLNITWDFLAKVTGDESLPDTVHTACLKNRMQTLSTPKLACKPYSSVPAMIGKCRYKVSEGYLTPYFYNTMLSGPPEGVEEFSFSFDDYGVLWHIKFDSRREETIRLATYGGWYTQVLGQPTDNVRLCAVNAAWEDDRVLTATLKWVETCFTKTLKFHFDETGELEIHESGTRPVVARALENYVKIQRIG